MVCIRSLKNIQTVELTWSRAKMKRLLASVAESCCRSLSVKFAVYSAQSESVSCLLYQPVDAAVYVSHQQQQQRSPAVLAAPSVPAAVSSLPRRAPVRRRVCPSRWRSLRRSESAQRRRPPAAPTRRTSARPGPRVRQPWPPPLELLSSDTPPSGVVWPPTPASSSL